MPSRATIASSKRRTPCTCSARIANTIAPAISPAGSSGTPKSRFRPSAAPRNSAMSVAIAITSAWIQSASDSVFG